MFINIMQLMMSSITSAIEPIRGTKRTIAAQHSSITQCQPLERTYIKKLFLFIRSLYYHFIMLSRLSLFTSVQVKPRNKAKRFHFPIFPEELLQTIQKVNVRDGDVVSVVVKQHINMLLLWFYATLRIR